MSMILTAQAMKLKIGNPARKLVLLKLADNANDEGVCFPSYQYIADHCEITKRSAITHIEKLIEMGLVSKKARKNKDGSSSNLYYLHLDKGSENFAPSSEMVARGSENISPPPSEMVSPITNHPINQSINHTPLTPKGESANAEQPAVGSDEKYKPNKSKNLSVDYQGVMEEFNLAVADTPISQIRVISDQRKRAVHSLAKLIKRQFGCYTRKAFGDYFRDFVAQANARLDRFYFGGLDGSRWVADFDYLLRAKTFAKTVENSL